MITVDTIVQMFATARTQGDRRAAIRLASRLPVADQLRVVDAAIASHRRISGPVSA